MTVAIGVVVPLVSAALAGLVAWIVARLQRHSSREQWVLDKRYEIYEAVLVAAAPLTSGLEWQDAVANARDRQNRLVLMRSLMALDLLAPEDIRERAKLIMVPLAESASGHEQALTETLLGLYKLIERLREDLVPEDMR